ncbi:MAG: hypothetical protein ABI222_02620 [Opitutaceae bacterium]
MKIPKKTLPHLPWLAAAAAASVALIFAAYTGHMWEDFLITFRSSLNLATGHGLVYQWGERVHSFTSPLGTLLPALFARSGETGGAVQALWWFRVVSALALGTGAYLVLQKLLEQRLAPVAIAAAVIALVLDPKIVDYSVNGMESAWVVMFVIITWLAFTNGARLLPVALAFAGLQWTRPDGCVFFGAIAAAWLFCGAPPGLTFPARGRAIVRGIALGALFYLPWVLIAWSYYGSPIPHTITAKVSHYEPGEIPWALAVYPARLLFSRAGLQEIFMPAEFLMGGWPASLLWVSRFIAVGAAMAWLVPGNRSGGRVASAAFFLGGFYVEIIPRSSWYYPGWQVLGLVAWAYLLDVMLRTENRPRWVLAPIPSLGRIVALLLIIVQAALLPLVAWEMKTQQSIIENGNRRELGRWLRAQAAPGDRVYLEPLGYIGYYSGLKMLDYPGLAAPAVVAARRAGFTTYAQIITHLKPEWLVLRPDQIQTIQAEQPELLHRGYLVAQIFDARPKINAVNFLPGRGYVMFDALFVVFQRAPAGPGAL